MPWMKALVFLRSVGSRLDSYVPVRDVVQAFVVARMTQMRGDGELNDGG